MDDVGHLVDSPRVAARRIDVEHDSRHGRVVERGTDVGRENLRRRRAGNLREDVRVPHDRPGDRHHSNSVCSFLNGARVVEWLALQLRQGLVTEIPLADREDPFERIGQDQPVLSACHIESANHSCCSGSSGLSASAGSLGVTGVPSGLSIGV